ncbi:hypothetical protein Misp03_40640 [Microbispora sp. NBRC 16548]|nr:hypothetical protein Misp03_40640 [Microbispora sp. NBRC 16548]
MLDRMIDQRCDDLYRAAETQDAPGFLATLQDLWERTEDSDPATADAVLVRLCGLFDRLTPGLGAARRHGRLPLHDRPPGACAAGVRGYRVSSCVPSPA